MTQLTTVYSTRRLARTSHSSQYSSQYTGGPLCPQALHSSQLNYTFILDNEWKCKQQGVQ
jgi:hypothetical protein